MKASEFKLCIVSGLNNLIDDYFGNFTARFGFDNDTADVILTKHAEAFLNEYEGAFRSQASK